MKFRLRNSFVSLSVLVFLASGCDSNKSQSHSKSSNNNSDSVIDDDGDADNQNNEFKTQKFFSDIRTGIEVPACKAGQTFAFEKCWDAVVMDADNFTITLNNTTESKRVFKHDTPILKEISDNYYFASSFYNRITIKNSAINAIDSFENALNGVHYWFLPSTMEITNNGDDDQIDLEGQEFKKGEFHLYASYSLQQSWFSDGNIKICGQIFALPLTQGNVEDACHIANGEYPEALISNDIANIRVTYSDAGIDKTGTHWLQKRRVSKITFEVKDRYEDALTEH